jgi:hypothetical protein
MSEQRPAGADIYTMDQWAHAGSPPAASASQGALTEVSNQLRQVAEALKAPLAQLGVTWQGQAADAAKAGISQHVQWAETTAQQVSTMAGGAGQYFNSAQSVIPQIDELMAQATAAAAAGGAGGPGGMAANAAIAEQAQAEAAQRGRELFQQHAGVCESSAPKVAATAPPTAGSGGKAAAVAEEAGAGAGRSVDKNAGATAEGEGGAVAEEPVGATTSASAAEGPHGVGEGAPGEAGGRPGSVPGYEPGAGGVVTAGGGYLPQTRARRTGYSPVYGASDDGLPGGSGSSRYSGDGFADEAMPAGGVLGAGGGTYRPGKPTPPAPRTRTVTPAPDGHADGYDDGALSGQGGGQGQQGQQQGMPGGGMMSPGMMGGAMAGGGQGQQGQRHDSPDYLLDEDDLFNGEDWVAPPVIRR